MTDALKWWELRRPEIDSLDRDNTLVVQPTGAVEQHGPHLPVDTDIHNPLSMAEALSERFMATSDSRVVVAPPLWWGLSPHHLGYPGTLSIRMEVMSDILVDICSSLLRHGFFRVLLLNGHGGNSGVLSATTLRISEELGLSVATTSYWQLIRDTLRSVGTSDHGGMGHACEMETSLQMSLRPERVDEAAIATHMPTKWTSFSHIDFRNPGSVMLPWNFGVDTETGTMGDPAEATADKGSVIFGAAVEQLELLAGELLNVPRERLVNPPSRSV